MKYEAYGVSKTLGPDLYYWWIKWNKNELQRSLDDYATPQIADNNLKLYLKKLERNMKNGN